MQGSFRNILVTLVFVVAGLSRGYGQDVFSRSLLDDAVTLNNLLAETFPNEEDPLVRARKIMDNIETALGVARFYGANTTSQASENYSKSLELARLARLRYQEHRNFIANSRSGDNVEVAKFNQRVADQLTNERRLLAYSVAARLVAIKTQVSSLNSIEFSTLKKKLNSLLALINVSTTQLPIFDFNSVRSDIESDVLITENILQIIVGVSSATDASQLQVSSINKAIFPGIEGATLNAALGAIADLMYERANTHMNNLLFSRLARELEGDSNAALAVGLLLPNCRSLFTAPDGVNISNALVNQVRSSFNEDVSSLPERIGTNPFIDNLTLLLSRSGVDTTKIEIRNFLELYGKLRNTSNIIEVLRCQELQDVLAKSDNDKVAFNVLELLLEATTTRGTNGYTFASVDYVQQCLTDDNVKEIYWELVQKRCEKLQLTSSGIFDGFKSNILGLRSFVVETQNCAQRLAAFTNFNTLPDSIKILRVTEFMVAFADLLANTNTLLVSYQLGESTINPIFSKIPIALRNIGHIPQAIQSGHYLDGVNYLISSIQPFLPENRNGNYLDTVFNGIRNVVGFYSLFANADTDEEVRKAVRQYAAPMGSEGIKRQSCFSISLQSYAGLSFGQEWLRQSSLNGWVFSPYGGIGLAFSTRVCPRNGNGHSLSLYGQLLDIGGLLAYRFDNGGISTNDLDSGQVSAFPEFEWKNFISPGAYFVFGLRNTPLSIGIGYQSGPMFRNFDDENSVLRESPTQRFSAFLAFDIPLYNIYHHHRFFNTKKKRDQRQQS